MSGETDDKSAPTASDKQAKQAKSPLYEPKEQRVRMVSEVRDFWEKMLELFMAGATPSAVAKEVGCDRRTAAQAWDQGWPRRKIPPIKQLVEQAQAKARMELAENNKVLQATRDGAVTREREAIMVRGARENVIGFQAATNSLMHGTMELSKKLRKEMEELARSNKRIDVLRYTRLIGAIASALRQANEAGLLAMRMERVLLGEPEMILGVEDMTLHQADSELRKATRAIERAKESGLVVLPGGKKNASGSSTG